EWLAVRRGIGQAQTERRALARTEPQTMMDGRLGADTGGVDGGGPALDHVVVKRVFDVRGLVRHAVEPLAVALVLGEEELRRALGVEPVPAERGMLGLDRLPPRAAGGDAQPWPR